MPRPAPGRPSLAPYAVKPVQQLLTDAAATWPDRVAIIDGDREFTFSALDTHSDRLAAALAGLGVAKGVFVGLLAPNCAEFEIAFFGVMKTGATVSTINSGYREREVAQQLKDCGATILIVHESLLEVAGLAMSGLESPPRLIVIAPDASDPDSFWGLLTNATGAPPTVDIDPMEDIAVLPYSSGTTGLSKGVMLTHHNLTSNVEQFVRRAEEAAPQHDDVVLVHLPLFHIYGMNVLMNPAIAVGSVQMMMGRFDIDEFLSLLARRRVTALYTAPPVCVALSRYPGVREHDLSALRMMLVGAAPLSADLQDRVQEVMGVPVIQGYGLTETSPVTNADFIEPDRRRAGSIGPGIADTEQKVVDLESGESEVPFGEPGELLIRGPQVMKGYFNNPRETAETFTADGWLRTGDIVRMDEDGYLWILDRKKELIKYKGFQVPPAELEGLLLEHEAVADCAVIGKADPEAGEIPKAFVVLKDGAQAGAEELMQFVAGRVATFKQVREVEMLDSIPKNPSGKILRRVLVERERAGARGVSG